MSEAPSSETPLRTMFNMKLNGQHLRITTVGEAYEFLTSYNSIEWMEFRTLHDAAIDALERAAENAIMAVQATNAVRALLVSAKLL